MIEIEIDLDKDTDTDIKAMVIFDLNNEKMLT